MKTLTEEEFKQKYGVSVASQFDIKTPEANLYDSLKKDLVTRGEKNVNLIQQGATQRSPMQNVTQGFKVAANTAGALGDVAGEAIKRTPVLGGLAEKAGSAIGKGFNAVTDKIAGTKFFQEAAQGIPEGGALEQGLEIGQASGEIAGNVLGAEMGVGGVARGASAAAQVPKAIGDIPKPNMGAAGQYVKGAVRDVVPTTQSYIDHQIAKALDLTPGDLSKIESSTGNQVGRFLADNNLIGTNKATTEGLIQGFYKTNYDAVRSAIGKVEKTYKPSQLPRFTDALIQLKKATEGVPGLEKDAVKIDNLLAKKEGITLAEVQTVKELLDDNFSLYKVTGDVEQGVAKQGLANIRGDLKRLIEKEVKENTGEDIATMNNSVQTARSLNNAIETRSTRGLTRNNLNTRDVMMGLGLTYFGSPLLGVAAILAGKLINSPTARLRIARFLDQKTDAYRAKLSKDLDKGVVPPEVKEALGEPLTAPRTQSPTPQARFPQEPIDGTEPSPKSIIQKAQDVYKSTGLDDQRGFVKNPLGGDPQAQKIAQNLNGSDVSLIQNYVNEPTLDNFMKLAPVIEGMGLGKMTANEVQELLSDAITIRNQPDFSSG